MTSAPPTVPPAVVCPLSESRSSDRALPLAADIAAAMGVPLRTLSYVEDRHQVAQRRAEVCGLAAGLPADRRNGTITVTVAIHPADALADVAESGHQVVMATSTIPLLHDGYIGSAAERVVRAASHPVVLSGPRCAAALADLTSVTVAVDDVVGIAQLLPIARAWARWLGGVPVQAALPRISGRPRGPLRHLSRRRRSRIAGDL